MFRRDIFCMCSCNTDKSLTWDKHFSVLSYLCHLCFLYCPICAIYVFCIVISVPSMFSVLSYMCHLCFLYCPICAIYVFCKVLYVPGHLCFHYCPICVIYVSKCLKMFNFTYIRTGLPINMLCFHHNLKGNRKHFVFSP